jgi:hypothetical protein
MSASSGLVTIGTTTKCRFCVNSWRFAIDGVVCTGDASVAVTRYRYRGFYIPTPWPPPKPEALTG